MSRILSIFIIVFGFLLFTYGALKLDKSAAGQIEAPPQFSVESASDQGGEKQFALRLSGSGVALFFVGGIGLLLSVKKRTN